jgi:hypothetical protein
MTKLGCIYFWFLSGIEFAELFYTDGLWHKLGMLVLAIAFFGFGLWLDRRPQKFTIVEHWARGRGLTVKLKNGVVLDLTEVPDGQK